MVAAGGETFLKRAAHSAATSMDLASARVREMLETIATGGEDAVRRYARELDGYEGDILLSPERVAARAELVDAQTAADIDAAHQRIHSFARAQRESLTEFEVELEPGLHTGQRVVPVDGAGCYVPGGRYAHVASALMSITTARAAEVEHVVATTPPRDGDLDPSIAYAMRKAGADAVLLAGGVQAVAALARGLFTGKPANVLVGPGNRYVAEAKRQLFGGVGIDMIAGPTEILVIADATADPELVAIDLVGQAEHGPDSPAWLVTTDEALGRAVLERVPTLIATLPEPNRSAARTAWADCGEVIVVPDRAAAARTSDRYAPEHLEVHATDLEWWRDVLRNYGSLFLGPETNVSYGDKCSGPNHILPTRGVARYSGGLSVHKFLKVLTWQRMSAEASARMAPEAARLCRAEGMEAHARGAEARRSD